MARKRPVFFRKIGPFWKFSRGWVARFLLALMGAFLCAVISPIWAAVPFANSAETENLVQQGKAFYEAGQFTEAIALLQQAEALFRATGERLRLAMILSNLSLAYQQLGQWPQAERAIADSLNLLQTGQHLEAATEQAQILAQTLDIQGRLQLARGQAEAALAIWQQAADVYARVGDEAGVTRAQINQAQALQALGLYRQAQKRLTAVQQSLQNQPDSPLKATGLRSLGNVYRVVGELEASRKVLEQSLAVARRSPSTPVMGETLLSLGNTARAQQDLQAAASFYQQAATISVSPATRIQSQLHQLSLLLETRQWNAALTLGTQIQSQIGELPASRTTVYAHIYLAQSLMKLVGAGLESSPSSIAQVLVTAVQQAKNLGDLRAKSAALGYLGELYEQTQQWDNAIELTQQALFIAQAIEAPDLAYRWQWQLGRTLKKQGALQGAIAAYTEAVSNLQSLRRDLVAIDPDVQFSFREQVEPVYRQLVDLLLRTEGNTEPTPENLVQARQTIESLQLAELDNFFREACLEAKVEIDKIVDQADPTAAVIYPIILPDRIEVILKLPQQPLHHYTTAIAQSQVERTLEQLRHKLIEPDTLKEAQSLSQRVYRWVLQPAATDLAQSQIETLVFVLDGALRNIPMAALYDGQQYLVEKYGIALAPGLQLVSPKPLKQQRLDALTAGLSQARHGFSRLNYVKAELEQIQSEVPSRVLLNQQFTTEAFQKQINSQPFPVVHLATHGQFSSSADQTFILAWDKPIKVNELNNLLQTRNQSQPEALELLVLSACETAAGDKRAVLGLAGVAVRAGARSTLASLWNVDDTSTALLMSRFYQELVNNHLSAAEALRRAQLSLLKTPQYQPPIFWSPYVLVGNWL